MSFFFSFSLRVTSVFTRITRKDAISPFFNFPFLFLFSRTELISRLFPKREKASKIETDENSAAEFKKAFPSLPSHSHKKPWKRNSNKKLLEHGSLQHQAIFLVDQPINTSSSFISLDIPSTNQQKTQLSKRAEEERTHHSKFFWVVASKQENRYCDNPKLLHLAKKIQQGKWNLVHFFPLIPRTLFKNTAEELLDLAATQK